jgi:hypothetical protein
VYRQIEFANRKSLAKWQRAELNEWISDNLFELTMFGLVDEPLRTALAELRAFQLGIDLGPNCDLTAREQVDQYLGIDGSDNYDDEFWDAEVDQAHVEAKETSDLFDEDEDDEQEDEDTVATVPHRKAYSEFYSKKPATVTR